MFIHIIMFLNDSGESCDYLKKKSAFILLSDFYHQLGLVTWLTINEGHLHLHFLPSWQGNHNSRLLERNWVALGHIYYVCEQCRPT